MKKLLTALIFLMTLGTFTVVNADEFDNLEGITPAQKEQIAQIQLVYKQEYNANETKIMDYTNKLNQIKQESNHDPSQQALLIGAYERNINALKSRQDQLKQETDEKYKSVLTEKQFHQYLTQQIKVENAFNDFLKK